MLAQSSFETAPKVPQSDCAPRRSLKAWLPLRPVCAPSAPRMPRRSQLLSIPRRCRPLSKTPQLGALRFPKPSALRLLTGALLTGAPGIATFFTTSFASAQAKVDHGISVQRFQAAPGPRNYFSMRGARTDGEKVWSAGMMLNYAFEPLVVRSCKDATNCDDVNARQLVDKKVVENMLTGDLLGSFTIIPRVQLGLRIPLTWVKGVGITETGNDETAGVNAFAIGDPELEGKFRLYGEPKAPFVIGATVFATAPVGQAMAEDKFIGDKHPTVGARAIFDGEAQGFSFGGNLAGAYRKSVVIGKTDIGSEFRYAVGAGYRVSPVFRVMAEGFGTTRFTTRNGENTLEGLGGIQIVPLGSAVQFTLGGGTGLVQGVGVPKVRAFLGVISSPRVRTPTAMTLRARLTNVLPSRKIGMATRTRTAAPTRTTIWTASQTRKTSARASPKTRMASRTWTAARKPTTTRTASRTPATAAPTKPKRRTVTRTTTAARMSPTLTTTVCRTPVTRA